MSPVRHPGAVLVGATTLALAAQPALLPHAWWAQAVTGGAAAAQAYGLAALTGRLTRRFPASMSARGDRLTLTLAAAVVGLGALVAHPGQLAVAARTDMAGPPLLAQALAVIGAVLVAMVLVRVGRGVRALARAARRRPRRAAVLAVAPALVLGTTGATAPPNPYGPAAAVGVVAEHGGRIGGAVGTKGREFLTRSNPHRAVRVYVAKAAAATPEERATEAVDALERAGGFEKGTVLIDVPTGSGWVNPQAVRSLETLTKGDVATVVVQYAASPSWLSYLKGGEGVQQSVRALVDTVEVRHPHSRVLVYGESLGAWGGLRAYDKPDRIENHVDGTLWAGVPGGAPTGGHTLIHDDDPVPAWSPKLIYESSPQWPRRWLPVVSFWQATADVISTPATPQGFGHKYGEEVSAAWTDLLAATPTYDSPS
jgi:uncharacterized membrane protein